MSKSRITKADLQNLEELLRLLENVFPGAKFGEVQADDIASSLRIAIRVLEGG